MLLQVSINEAPVSLLLLLRVKELMLKHKSLFPHIQSRKTPTPTFRLISDGNMSSF